MIFKEEKSFLIVDVQDHVNQEIHIFHIDLFGMSHIDNVYQQ